MSQYIGGEYGTVNPTWHETDSEWKAIQVIRMLNRHQLHPDTVCDIGCGTGGVLGSLRERLGNATLVGWDISPYAIELGHTLHPKLDIRCGDVLATTDRYDLILVLDVFEHVEDYLAFLRAVKHLGQRFIFHIPLDMSVQMVFRVTPILKARTQIGHLHYFSRETALATLETAGYLVDDSDFTRSGLDLPKSRLARLAKWPRAMAMSVSPEITVRVLGGCSLLVLAHSL